MKAKHAISNGLGFLVFLLTAPLAGAYWVQDGIPVCTEPGEQNTVLLAPDGRCGAIAAWRDYRAGNGDVYAQKIDLQGRLRWTTNGVPVCTQNAVQKFTGIASDGLGGAFVVWEDHRGDDGGDIYMQRIDSSGNPQWQTDGIAVCSEIAAQVDPVVVADGSGGAIVAWIDLRDFTGVYKSVYAQRIRRDGSRVFAPNGIPVATGLYARDSLRLAPDEHGGAHICWREKSLDLYGFDCHDLMAARIDSTGARIMEPTRIFLGITWPDGTPADDLQIVSDCLGGAFYAWYDRRNHDADLFAQYIDADGTRRWTGNGKVICGLDGAQYAPALAPDGDGGVFIIWEDYAEYPGGFIPDLSAQRVTADGVTLWPTNGVAVVRGGGYELLPRLIADGTGGAIAVWHIGNLHPSSATNLVAQRVTPAGAMIWPYDPNVPQVQGTYVCQAPEAQQYPAVVTNHAGGAICAWEDWRPETESDIYAQWLGPGGSWELPTPVLTAVDDVPGDQGGWVRVNVSASAWDSATQSDRAIVRYSLWRRIATSADPSQSDPDGFPPGTWECLGSQPAVQAGDYTFTAATRASADAATTPWETFVVTAHTSLPALFFVSNPDSGYAADDLAPAMPAGLAAAASYMPRGLRLEWQASPERDLAHYAVYRGLDPDFVPSAGNRIGSPAETAFLDCDWQQEAGFYYKVSAVDRHANESDHALVRPEDVTGAQSPDVPSRTRLAQNVPNPFNPATRIAFDLSAAGRVELRIYDATGRLVRTLVDGFRDAAHHQVRWDGTDSSGFPVGSGVYFYRLHTGGLIATKRMTLIR